MRYGKINGGRIVYAPRVVRMKDGAVVVNPKATQYAAAVDGPWLPVVDERPTTDEDHIAVPTGWEERDGAVRRLYEIRERPPRPPRTFSKLKVVAALTNAGAWQQVKAWIEGAGLYDLYLAAQDFAEDNGYFVQGKTALQSALGWTDEQVEKILSAAEVR